MIPFASDSIHTGNSLQGHLTHLPQLSAGAPIDPAGPWCEGPLSMLEAGASLPRRPLSAYNMLSAGVSPPPYSIQCYNATEPEEVMGFDLYAGFFLLEEKSFYPPPILPSLSPTSSSFANLREKKTASFKRDHAIKEILWKDRQSHISSWAIIHNMCSVLYESPCVIGHGWELLLRRRPSVTLHCVAVHRKSADLAWLEWDIRGVSWLCHSFTHSSPHAKHTQTCSRQLTTIKWTEEEKGSSLTHNFSRLPLTGFHILLPLLLRGQHGINIWMSDSESGWLISWVADFMGSSVFTLLELYCMSCCVLYSGHLAGCCAAE